MLLQQQPQNTGQELPSGSSTTATSTTGSTASQPTSSPSATQFVSDTLQSLLSAQEGPPTPSQVSSQIMSVADTNGDGSLSLSEIENALGMDSTTGSDSASGTDTTSGSDASTGADALAQAFAKIDTNGDGEISADELTNALAAQNSSQGAQGPQGAHHGHHRHHMGGAGGANGADSASSTDLASQLLGSADTNGDGSLSLSEAENVLGVSSTSTTTDALSQAFNSLDSNGDGQLSSSEIAAGIDAFRAAHHRGGMENVQAQPTAQAVTA